MSSTFVLDNSTPSTFDNASIPLILHPSTKTFVQFRYVLARVTFRWSSALILTLLQSAHWNSNLMFSWSFAHGWVWSDSCVSESYLLSHLWPLSS